MSRNPILDVSLTDVMRREIALPLQQMFSLYTVGQFLRAWSVQTNHQRIERVFDTPEQAHHAAAVCAAWLGCRSSFTPPPEPVVGWWSADDVLSTAA
jgi:hypothetical protein